MSPMLNSSKIVLETRAATRFLGLDIDIVLEYIGVNGKHTAFQKRALQEGQI